MDYDVEERSEEIIEKADKLRNSGHHEKAINLYSDAIVLLSANNRYGELSSKLSSAYAGLAKCYKSLGNEEKFKEYMAIGFEKMGDSYGYILSIIPASRPSSEIYELQQKRERMYEQAKKYRGEDCFITSAVFESFGKSDDCYELMVFRNFRDNWLALQSDGKNLIDEYYKVAPKIVVKINSLTNSAEVYKNIWRDYLSKCLKSIEVGDDLNCKKIYVNMVNNLKEKFLK